jgi:hypothetical protein
MRKDFGGEEINSSWISSGFQKEKVGAAIVSAAASFSEVSFADSSSRQIEVT